MEIDRIRDSSFKKSATQQKNESITNKKISILNFKKTLNVPG